MTKCKKNINPLNWKTALTLSLVISFIISILVLTMSIERAQTENLNPVFLKAVRLLVLNIITLFLLYMFTFKVIQIEMKSSTKTIVVILGVLLIAVVLALIVQLITTSVRQIEFSRLLFLARMSFNIFMGILVLFSAFQLYSRHLRQQILIENERLIAENIRNRYEALKNQIDPHFLFNSLNTLNGLIGFDNNRAHKYVEKLSSVFRYTIQNKEVTTLQEELNFTDSYAYLMKIRYGENFEIEHDVSEKYLSYYIMPISIQLLIENAVKHNVISNKYPLKIRIYTTRYNTIVVENRIQPKAYVVPSSGIGLANLSERYKMLFQKEIVISNNTSEIFRVEIPLIKSETLKNLLNFS